MRFLISCALFLCVIMNKRLEGDVAIIGHRGASGHAPENTLASFTRALEIGVDAIELDVHLAKSGELVVIHDKTVDRVSNGKGLVADKTLEELKEYALEGGEKIPTLDEVCDLIDKRCIINIELKGPSTARPVAELIRNRVLEKGWSFEHFFVSSFNHHELYAFHQLLPQVQTGALLEGIPFSYAAFAEDIGATHAVVYYHSMNPAFVQDAHNRRLQVFVYTVNDPKDMERLIAMGVDGIITNYPDRVKALMKENKDQLKIITIDSPLRHVLKTKTAQLQDDELPLAREIVEKLMLALKPYLPAAGLAAPQIGISKSVFIFSYDRDPNNLEGVINPSFIPVGDAKIEGWEGCFSIMLSDGGWKLAKIPRYETIKVQYLNIDGKRIEKILEGFAAKVFQHEYDHLQGIENIEREDALVKGFTSKEEMMDFMKQVKKEDSLRYKRPN